MTTAAPEPPSARHRAAGSGRLRTLPVALGVLLVVGVAAWTATGLGAGTSPEAAHVDPPPPSVATASPSDGPTGALPPGTGSSDGTTGSVGTGSVGTGSVGTGSVSTGSVSTGSSVPAEVAPAGDPIPGPGAPARPAGDLTPTALRIPAIDLDVPLVQLGLLPDGAIDVPDDPDDAGWLTASAVPGRTGPAVVAGHVDSADGAAVFTRLEELAPGAEVQVSLDDGTTTSFVVTRSERYAKDAFPSDAVYGPAPVPVLRLITCGGTFDRAAGSYEDNLVVYAVPMA